MSKRKKKKSNPPQVMLKPESYIRKVARNQPIYECKIPSGWEEMGLTPVIVSRRKPNGNIILGTYVVDFWCLGLKDTTYWSDLTILEYDEILQKITADDMTWMACTPTLAFNLIYGAIEYAEDLGFKPHKDFAVSEYILDDVEDINYLELEFGKNGRPCLVQGPFDNADAIIKTLDKNVGSGNYNVLMPFSSGDYYTEEEEEEDYEEYEDYEEIPFILKPSLISELGESGRIDAKLAQLEGEEKQAAFALQVNIANYILNYFDNDLETLMEDDYEYEDVEEIVEILIEETERRMETAGESISDEDRAELFMHYQGIAEWLIEKIIENKGVDFLVAPDYEPLPPPDLSEEAYANLSQEERIEYDTLQLSYLPSRVRDEILLMSFIEPVLDNWMPRKNPEEIDDAFREEVLNAVFTRAREHFPEFDQPDNNYVKSLMEEVTYQLIDNYDDFTDQEA